MDTKRMVLWLSAIFLISVITIYALHRRELAMAALSALYVLWMAVAFMPKSGIIDLTVCISALGRFAMAVLLGLVFLDEVWDSTRRDAAHYVRKLESRNRYFPQP